jgi:hypothetical protein
VLFGGLSVAALLGLVTGTIASIIALAKQKWTSASASAPIGANVNRFICGSVAGWSARILSLLFAAVVMLFVFAQAVSGELPRVWQEPPVVQLEFVALLLMTVGGVAGWKWPSAASVIMLFGYVVWWIIERRLPWPPGLIEIALLTGLLYAIDSWSGSRSIAQQRRAVL